jgi:hypothetical protein
VSNADSVAQYTAINFGSIALTPVPIVVPLTATGNAVVALPMLSGGLTGTTGSVILRRITVSNPSNVAGGTVPNMSTANVAILTSNDGNASNAVVAAGTISNVTGALTYQDLSMASATLTKSYNTNALFVQVNTSVANSAIQICVYGDVVQF